LCEEAATHYTKALSDPGIKQYANSMLDAVRKLKDLIEKEKFVRE